MSPARPRIARREILPEREIRARARESQRFDVRRAQRIGGRLERVSLRGRHAGQREHAGH
jgi:hypothetical protein